MTVHLFDVVYFVMAVLVYGSHALTYQCYPNGTIDATNPDTSTYTQAYAVDSADTVCTVAYAMPTATISDCNIDTDILLTFSDRSTTIGDDDILAGDNVKSFSIRCGDIGTVTNIPVTNILGVSLSTNQEASVTPAFSVTSGLHTSATATTASVTEATIGTALYWTFDIPDEYYATPTSCTASSGTSYNSATNKEIIMDGCSEDIDLIGNFAGTDTSTIAGTRRYFATLTAFKFYDSASIYLECDIDICSDMTNCDIGSCTKKRRAVADGSYADGLVHTIRVSTSLGVKEELDKRSSSSEKVSESSIVLLTTTLLLLAFCNH